MVARASAESATTGLLATVYVSPATRTNAVPFTVRVQISLGCGVSVNVTVVTPALLAEAVGGVMAPEGEIDSVVVHADPVRLTTTRVLPSVIAVMDDRATEALIAAANVEAMVASVVPEL